MITRLDPRTGVPLYLQIAEAMRDAIAAGRILPGRRLPTVRETAAKLRVNPGTVVAAYDMLAQEGLIESRQGAGTFVTAAGREEPKLRRAARERLDGLVHATVRTASAAGVSRPELVRQVEKTYTGAQRELEKEAEV